MLTEPLPFPDLRLPERKRRIRKMHGETTPRTVFQVQLGFDLAAYSRLLELREATGAPDTADLIRRSLLLLDVWLAYSKAGHVWYVEQAGQHVPLVLPES